MPTPAAVATLMRPSVKRKRSLIEDTIGMLFHALEHSLYLGNLNTPLILRSLSDEAEVKYRSEHLNPEQVQIRATTGEVRVTLKRTIIYEATCI